MSASVIPTAEDLVVRFLLEKRYPVKFINPFVKIEERISVFFDLSLDGAKEGTQFRFHSPGRFGVDLSNTHLHLSFDFACKDQKPGKTLQDMIVQQVREKLLDRATFYLLPDPALEPSIETLKLFADEDVVGVVPNQHFEGYWHMFPEKSEEHRAIKLAVEYHRLTEKKGRLPSPPPQSLIDAKGDELKKLLAA